MKTAVLVALLALGLGACGGDIRGSTDDAAPTASATPADGDTLIDSLLGNISGLIPNITSDSASHEVGNLIYSGLVKHDRDLNIVGDLATSWTLSRDCLGLTLSLRRDAKWHDGRPFTADDVVFTYDTMVNPNTPTAYRDSFLQIARIKALDPYTVHVEYKAPYAKALSMWSEAMLPKHLLEEHVRAGKLREAPQNRSEPVGTGPYRFKEWRPGEKVVLVANPDHYAGRPHLSRVVYRIIPSQATMFLELKAGGLDSASLTALQYKRQTEYRAFEKAYNKYRYPANGYTYFGFNLRNPLFADKRVRQALAHAVNKREIIDGVILGLGREATGPFKPGTWPHDPTIRGYAYDPTRARALLAAAGWTEKNEHGILVKDGRPFAFELLTNQGNDERKKVAEIIQAELREVGVAVEIRVLEWASLLKEYVKKRRFDALVLGWGIGRDPDQYVVWHSSQSGPDQLNQIGFANAEVDDLLEKGRTTCRQEDRVQYYHRIHAILAEEQPIVFLYFRDALPVVASRVHGIVPSPNGISYNFINWFVPTHLQRYTAG